MVVMAMSKRIKATPRLERIQTENAPEWAGLKRHVRQRLAWACAYLVEHGELNRRHMVEALEVHSQTAVTDLREIKARAPWLMEYDLSAKTYRLKVKS